MVLEFTRLKIKTNHDKNVWQSNNLKKNSDQQKGQCKFTMFTKEKKIKQGLHSCQHTIKIRISNIQYFKTGRFLADSPAGWREPLLHEQATLGRHQLCSETGKPLRLPGQQVWTPGLPSCRCWHCLFVPFGSSWENLQFVKSQQESVVAEH